MFLDFSLRKLGALVFAVTIVAVAVAASLFADSTWYVAARAESIAMRAWYEALYMIVYRPRGGFADAQTEGHARSVPVLLYHGEDGGLDMPLSVFVDQMRALRENGWRTITMDQFRAFMKEGTPVPDKSFLLTFDDGRTDTYYPADPVMKDMGLHAVMFVISGFSLPEPGAPRYSFYLDRVALSAMQESGRWDLESHGKYDHSVYAVQTSIDPAQDASTTQGHFLSNIFWNPDTNRFETDSEFELRVTHDLKDSKRALENAFGKPVPAFAFPFNDYGQDSVNFPGSQKILARVVPTIYEFAFYQVWAGIDSFNYSDPDRWMIKRIEPKNDWSGMHLVSLLEAGRAKDLPYMSTRFGAEWGGSWGRTTVSDTSLTVAAASDTYGASAFLNGTGIWKDYRYGVRMTWPYTTTVSLIARYHDGRFISCAFGSKAVMLEHHEGLNNTVIAERERSAESFAESGDLMIDVHGSRATCYENGVAIVSGETSDPPQGGVGVSVWSGNKSMARATVTSVTIVP